jgi:hypothetical protein
MIGCILLGAASLMLVSRALHRHHHGWHGRWAFCGHGPFGRFGHHHGHGEGPDYDGYGPRFLHGGNPLSGGFFVRALADRLDATRAQEKVIREATDEFRQSATKLKGEGQRTRADLAAAFRKGSFDEVMLGELYARHDRSLEDLRKAFVGMGARIHEVLDDEQRAQLADMIEAGPKAWRPRWGRRGWS